MARKKKKEKKEKPAPADEARFVKCRRIAGRFAIRAVKVLLLVYVALVIFGCTLADKLIFPVPPASYTADAPNLVRLPLQGGGEVPALWLENKDAKYTILYFHGNGYDIGHAREYAQFFRDQGFSMLVVEYPGYGITGGSPSEDGCYRAADAGYDYLKTVKGIPENRIALYGFSLGTGVAVDLASRQNAGALVLESPFLSTFRVKTVVKLVPYDKFDSYAKIENVKCPLLVAHGTADRVIPFWHGKQLFESATCVPRKQFYIFENGGHGGHGTHEYKKFFEEMKKFLDASE